MNKKLKILEIEYKFCHNIFETKMCKEVLF